MSTARPLAGLTSDRTSPSSQDGATSWSDPSQVVPLIMLVAMTVGLVAAYRDTLTVCWSAWADPQYSHGYLIPVFTLAMLWMRQKFFRTVPAHQRWIGLGILTIGLAVRIASSMLYSVPAELLSFLVCLFGIFILVGGFHLLRWSWPWIGFLIFMFPLPSVLEHALLWNLKTVATYFATYFLQILGFAANNVVNVIYIEGTQVEVADVCSGLRMATIFGAMAVAIALLIEKPWWDRLIILLSAVPIALFVNVLRIAVTAICYWKYEGNERVLQWVHDIAGYAMPILALGFMWFILSILERLTVTDDEELAPIGFGKR